MYLCIVKKFSLIYPLFKSDFSHLLCINLVPPLPDALLYESFLYLYVLGEDGGFDLGYGVPGLHRRAICDLERWAE